MTTFLLENGEEKNRKFLAQDETKWQENYQFKNEDNTFEENIELMRIKMESWNRQKNKKKVFWKLLK